MKYLIIFIIFAISSNTFSQYIWQKVSDYGGIPIKMYSIDSVHCIALLRNDIFYSNNGGFSWNVLVDELDDFIRINDIAYPDTNHIIVFYHNNTIVKYNQEGVPWDTLLIEPELQTTYSVREKEIFMSDTSLGILNINDKLIITTDGWQNYKILKPDSSSNTKIYIPRILDENNFSCYSFHNYFFSQNGGESFEKLQFDFTANDNHYINDNIGYLKGYRHMSEPSNSGKEILYKTTDKGKTWEKLLDTIVDNNNFSSNQIEMKNENNGTFVSGRGVIVMTDDGFKTFNREYIDDVGNGSPYLALTYSGNRPIVAVQNRGIYTRVDTVYLNMKAPELIAPSNLINFSKGLTDFHWSKITDIKQYVFHLSFENNFNNLIRDDTINPPSFPNSYARQVLDLNNCQKYYWRVGAIKQNTIKWSDTWSFTIVLDKAVLETPSNNATEIDYDTDVNWKELNGAERYHLQCAYDESFNDLFFSQDTLTKTTYLLEDLPEDKEIYWRVRGYCKEGFAEWSEVWKFRTKKSTSVRYSEGDRGIRIKPNPAGDYITITFDRCTPPSKWSPSDKVQIFDMLGIEIISESIHPMTASHRMNVEKLPAGVYFIRIGNKVEKFVKY